MRGLELVKCDRIFVYNEPVRMGKSFKGLATIIEKSMKRKALSGEAFLFMNKKRTYLKVFQYIKGKLVILCALLPSGTFDFESIQGSRDISLKEMSTLLDVTVKRNALLKLN